jgi:hypothetical protein
MRLCVERPFAIGAVSALALAPLFALRLHQAEPGLLYPDGYQYLLMAKGIAAHGRPLLTLGLGGDTLLPNADAAAKPLFPALVALVHALGFGWLAAARTVNALAGAVVVVLAAQLARRLTGSWMAAVVAATACVASRELAFWGGFAGPDALGQALALASALALLARRPRVGGVLAALAVLARPEMVLLAIAGATVGVARVELRQATSRALVSFITALAVVLACLRPPLGELPLQALAIAALAAVIAGAVFLLAAYDRGEVRVPIVVGAVVALALVVALGGLAPGMRQWAHNDWPLLLAGLGGCVFAATTRRLRTATCAIVLAAALLALVYALKNPGADRYLSLLTPLVAVLASLPTAAAMRAQRRVGLLAVASLFGATLALGGLPARAPDGFPAIARQLQALNVPSLPIVTAAPDAYGVLLPQRRVRIARPGVNGLIILDGAMRAYDPNLRLSGRALATLDPGAGFVRPDGAVDRRPVRVTIGTVARRERRLLASRP